jgi:hypothetical protein
MLFDGSLFKVGSYPHSMTQSPLTPDPYTPIVRLVYQPREETEMSKMEQLW